MCKNSKISKIKEFYYEVIDTRGKRNFLAKDAIVACVFMTFLFVGIMILYSFKVNIVLVYMALNCMSFLSVVGSYFRYNNGTKEDEMVCTRNVLVISLIFFVLLCVPYLFLDWLHNRLMKKVNLKMYSQNLMLMMFSLLMVVFYIRLMIIAYMEYTHHNMFSFVIFGVLSYLIVIKGVWSLIVICMYRGKHNAYKRYKIHIENSHINTFLIAMFTFIRVIIASFNEESLNDILTIVIIISAVETLIKQLKYFDNKTKIKKCLIRIMNDLEMCSECLNQAKIEGLLIVRFKFDLFYLHLYKDANKMVKNTVEIIDNFVFVQKDNSGVMKLKQYYCIPDEKINYTFPSEINNEEKIRCCTRVELFDTIMEVLNSIALLI